MAPTTRFVKGRSCPVDKDNSFGRYRTNKGMVLLVAHTEEVGGKALFDAEVYASEEDARAASTFLAAEEPSDGEQAAYDAAQARMPLSIIKGLSSANVHHITGAWRELTESVTRTPEEPSLVTVGAIYSGTFPKYGTGGVFDGFYVGTAHVWAVDGGRVTLKYTHEGKEHTVYMTEEAVTTSLKVVTADDSPTLAAAFNVPSLNAILSLLRALPRSAKTPTGSICVHEVCEVLKAAGHDISGFGEITAEMPFLFSLSAALNQLQSDLNDAGAFAASSSAPAAWPTSDAKALGEALKRALKKEPEVITIDDTSKWPLASAFLALASSPLSATRALHGIIDLTHNERQSAWLAEREEAARAALDKQLSLLPDFSTVSKIKQIAPPPAPRPAPSSRPSSTSTTQRTLNSPSLQQQYRLSVSSSSRRRPQARSRAAQQGRPTSTTSSTQTTPAQRRSATPSVSCGSTQSHARKARLGRSSRPRPRQPSCTCRWAACVPTTCRSSGSSRQTLTSTRPFRDSQVKSTPLTQSAHSHTWHWRHTPIPPPPKSGPPHEGTRASTDLKPSRKRLHTEPLISPWILSHRSQRIYSERSHRAPAHPLVTLPASTAPVHKSGSPHEGTGPSTDLKPSRKGLHTEPLLSLWLPPHRSQRIPQRTLTHRALSPTRVPSPPFTRHARLGHSPMLEHEATRLGTPLSETST